ncbi:monooxygenase [Fibrella arboris]|uniref:monooxygenase n=1 Tax=Fibrella arboris TaxID=3242486 RepID=UPI003522E099
MMTRVLLTATFGAALLVASCKKNADVTTPDLAKTSFELIQDRILTPSCATAGCHASEADAAFRQHGLVLAAGVAYKNLVGVAPKNAESLADGHKRVKPFVSLESLLFHKLNVDASHHSGKSYGNPMPLGSEALSVGQIEFVRRWIEGGALATGNAIDPALLDDKTPSTAPNSAFTPPAAPASGQGYQLKVDAFDVATNFEREIFVRRAVGNPTDIYVNRFTVSMRPGSHHFLAYDFDNKAVAPPMDQVRDLRNADGTLNLLTALQMSNHTYLMGSPSMAYEYKFPEGAALLIPANSSFDLNVHYVNKSTSVIRGESYINMYTTPQASVTKVVKTLNMANTSLSIPAGARKTFTKSFTVGKPSLILSLTSHMHKLGEKFVIRIKGGARDGEIVYTTTDWEHPDVINFATPIQLAKGEGLTSEITYNNTTNKTVQFGLTSDDEMGIIFGYYYEVN